MPDVAVLIAIVAAAGLVQGIAGFGFGLVSMGILVTVLPYNDAIVMVAVLVFFSVGLNLYTVRKHICWRDVLPIMATALPATAAGVLAINYVDKDILRLVVAIMIFVGCAVSLWAPKKELISRAFPWGYLAGLVGGVIGGAVNTGGPPVVMYSLARNWDKSRAKCAMSVYFMATDILRVALLVSTGVATSENVRLGLMLAPVGLLAGYAGTCIFKRMSTPAFRYATMALLVALAIRIIVT